MTAVVLPQIPAALLLALPAAPRNTEYQRAAHGAESHVVQCSASGNTPAVHCQYTGSASGSTLAVHCQYTGSASGSTLAVPVAVHWQYTGSASVSASTVPVPAVQCNISGSAVAASQGLSTASQLMM